MKIWTLQLPRFVLELFEHFRLPRMTAQRVMMRVSSLFSINRNSFSNRIIIWGIWIKDLTYLYLAANGYSNLFERITFDCIGHLNC